MRIYSYERKKKEGKENRGRVTMDRLANTSLKLLRESRWGSYCESFPFTATKRVLLLTFVPLRSFESPRWEGNYLFNK